MNAERLLQHFERICEAPDGVPRLRQFILDLAVRGELVEQDPFDEPAGEFYKRIQSYRGQLTRAGRESTHLPLREADLPFVAPPGWVWVRFGSIIVCRDGERIPVSKDERNRRSKIYDYYGASGVIDKIDGFLFDKPLLLIGEDGANLINRSTPIAFIARGKYWVNNHAHVVDGITEEFLRYLELYINAIDLKPYVTGTAQPKMNQAKMNDIPIALPPEAEQSRIVARVDELMSLCDQLEAAQAKREKHWGRLVGATLHGLTNGEANLTEDGRPTFEKGAQFFFNHLAHVVKRPEHIQQFRQTILNLAVRGKLVPQDPDDEPVSELLRTVEQERALLARQMGLRFSDSLPPVGDDEVPFRVPQSWQWVRVSDVAHSRLGKMLDQMKNKGIPRRYLRNVNVRWFDFDLSDLAEMKFEDSELEEFSLKQGDVLACEGGEPGRAAVWDQRDTDVYFQKAIHRVRFFGSIVPTYFVRCLYLDACSGRLAQFFTGVGIKHLTGKGLARYTFPLPPIAEQQRIVARVDELMALCDELEARLTETASTQNQLLEALIHEALVG